MKTLYDSVQIMRGIAALSVITVHVGMVHNGAFGVDLFFCISGFIMMHVTEKSDHHFLQKRAIRIIPVYWITNIVISAVLIIKPDLFRTVILTPEHFIKSMLFIPYYYTGKSGVTVSALNLVGWTLILEVFFYFLFFTAMKISHKYRHYIATGGLVVLVVIGLADNSDNTFTRFYCSSIMLEFSLGMFAYKILTRSDTKKWGTFATVSAVFVAVLIWLGLYAVKYVPPLSELTRVIIYGLPTFVFFLLVFKALEGRSMSRPLIVLGNISYSLYLTHSFVVQGFSRLVYDIDKYSFMGMVLIFVVIIPTIIIIAWVSWWLVENKFTGWIKRQLGV